MNGSWVFSLVMMSKGFLLVFYWIWDSPRVWGWISLAYLTRFFHFCHVGKRIKEVVKGQSLVIQSSVNVTNNILPRKTTYCWLNAINFPRNSIKYLLIKIKTNQISDSKNVWWIQNNATYWHNLSRRLIIKILNYMNVSN
jgi:hypothetical protein